MKRKRYSDEQIMKFLREVERSSKTVTEACRELGISEQSYYRWRTLTCSS